MQINKYAMIPNPLSAERYQELKSSIEKYGQHIPIVLHKGEILDGRHRYQACIELGIEPKFENRDDVDPCQYVKDALPLREFTASIRAFTFAELDKVRIAELREAAKQEQGTRTDLVATLQRSPEPKETARVNHTAANEANVSPRTMADAIKVSEQASENLKAAVKRGDITVSQAAVIADLPEAIQTKAVETKTVKELIKIAPDLKHQQKEHSEFISIKEWDLLDAETQESILVTNSNKTFNKQQNDSIEWAQWSWNPLTGCLHNCQYCYAKNMASRFNVNYAAGFQPAIYPDRLNAPSNTTIDKNATTNQRNVFVCSMSDIMGAWNPVSWINAIIEQCKKNTQFNFLLLTKNPKRYLDFDFPANCWLGATIDCQARVKATLDVMRQLKDRRHLTWISFEPLTESLSFGDSLKCIDWAVIGGQTGANKFFPDIDWTAKLHLDARLAGCAIYHKANLGFESEIRKKQFPENSTNSLSKIISELI